jgi:phosphonate metabolism protein PhnN/1,5-bisphosphokinase (PRPP-forming)
MVPATPDAGTLVLVVGPSGAGKDTLMEAARVALADDPQVLFARRLITRRGGLGEDHDSCDLASFEAAERAGALALSWRAHGLAYGIPAGVLAELAAGRTVVANVSRAVIPQAEKIAGNVLVLEVTASAPVLAARLAGRGRESAGDIEARLAREAPVVVTTARHVVVRNETSVEAATRAFVAALREAPARLTQAETA